MGFRKKVAERLTQMLDKANSGAEIELHVGLSHPVSNLEDYDEVIAMLEMTTDKEVELTSDQFRQYVMDKWHWRASAYALNQSYIG